MNHYGSVGLSMGNPDDKLKGAYAQMVAAKCEAFDMLARQTKQLDNLTREKAQLNALLQQACSALGCDPDNLIETAKCLAEIKNNEKPAK